MKFREEIAAALAKLGDLRMMFDLSRFGQEKEDSWYEDPARVVPYRERRHRKKKRVARMRRTRYTRGQNPRTGARKK